MFKEIANGFLERLSDQLEALEDELDAFEIECTDGVLTMDLGDDHGTWVLNKQGPNRQIWWSSPISGPKRYGLSASGDWLNSRDGHRLLDILDAELGEIFGADVVCALSLEDALLD
jgi:frataxin